MAHAKITITSGPDRGKVFELNDELVNIGHGPDNEVPLSDASLEDYQASITSRKGRYAIYTPLERVIEVDGNAIPADRWVWLPPHARVRVSPRTAFQFSYQAAAPTASDPQPTPRPADADATATPPAARRSRAAGQEASPPAKRPEKRRRNVARFITDQAGDTLVKLGEDGHLPELTLTEGAGKRAHPRRQPASHSTVLYAALAASTLLSVVMLLIDAQPDGTTALMRTAARQELVEFYATQDDEPLLYQRHLREARLAHSRGDRAAEHAAYRRVLALLNAEDNDPFTGLTGSPARDERLRKVLVVLLSE